MLGPALGDRHANARGRSSITLRRVVLALFSVLCAVPAQACVHKPYITTCAAAQRGGHHAVAAVRISGDKEPFGWIYHDRAGSAFFRFATSSGDVFFASKTIPRDGEKLGTLLRAKTMVPTKTAEPAYAAWWRAERVNTAKTIHISACSPAPPRAP